jgi:enterochelin esterase family protein
LRSSLTALFGNGVSSPAHELGNLARLPGTDAYFVTAEVPNELRASYRFEVTGRDQPIVDPLNPRVFLPKTEFAESQFALSKSPAQPWTDVRVAGTWQEHRVPSVTLGAPQPVWIYTPAGYDPSAAPYPAFIGLDSVTYGRILPTARVTEYLVARQQVRPTLIVAAPDLAEVGDRGSYDPAVTFLADELLPWVRARYRVSARPSDIVISGASRRGMLAAYAAFRRPDAFQRVLSLSGSFYWRPPGHPEFEWLPALVAREPARPLRIYLAAGSLETVVTPTNVGHYLLATNRHMRSVLQAKGYEMRYVEFCGSHSPINWQDQLLPGLAYLMPPP